MIYIKSFVARYQRINIEWIEIVFFSIKLNCKVVFILCLSLNFANTNLDFIDMQQIKSDNFLCMLFFIQEFLTGYMVKAVR